MLEPARVGGGLLVGHGGSMPGFRASMWVDREQRTVALAMANATTGLDPDLGPALLGQVAEDEPRIAAPWEPAGAVDPMLLTLTGVWYWGPAPFALRAVKGTGDLELTPLEGGGRGGSFEAVDRDHWRGRDGYFAGEILQVVRDDDGAATHLRLASFVLTRALTPRPPTSPAGSTRAGGADRLSQARRRAT